METDKYTPPTETILDHAHTAGRVALSFIPNSGDLWTELFSAVIAPPFRKRQQAWANTMAEGVRELERQQKCVFENLSENEAFIDAVLQASPIAVKTSQNEKREALKNAVLNSALPSSLDESKRARFISLIDDLTVWHLRLLRWFVNPLAWYQENNKTPRQITLVGSIPVILGEAFPELAGERELLELYVDDLQSAGLLSKFMLFTNMGGDGIYAERGTSLGKEFLAFIKSPL